MFSLTKMLKNQWFYSVFARDENGPRKRATKTGHENEHGRATGHGTEGRPTTARRKNYEEPYSTRKLATLFRELNYTKFFLYFPSWV